MNLTFALRQRPKVAQEAFYLMEVNGALRVPLVCPLLALVTYNLSRMNGAWRILKITRVLLNQAGNTTPTLDPGNASPAGPKMIILPSLDSGILFLGSELII